MLKEEKKIDWEDVPLRLGEVIESGKLPTPRYHAILVDETQDFAPSWFRVLLRMLNPETNLLFLVGDGAQRVYRPDLRWTRLGIPLQGRSWVLHRVYRNTAEIAQFAVASLPILAAVAEDLAQYGEDWIEAELDHPWTRHGAEPTLQGFATQAEECAFVVGEIRGLLSRGHSPADILILQAYREYARRTAQALNQVRIPAVAIKDGGLRLDPPAVNVCTFHSAKGLEFPIAFCSMTDLFPESRRGDRLEDPREKETEAARLLYVGMTRARDVRYVTYQAR
jgi:superfamily I DNA/RNA helicase